MPDPVTPPNPDTGAAPPWFANFDDANKGHLQAKGWDKLDAPAAALAALNAYKGVESKLGIPADRVLKLPEPTDAEGQKALWQRLGVPADATGYDFTGVQAEEPLLNFLRDTSLKLNIPKDVAPELAKSFVGYNQQIAERQKAEAATAVAAEQAQLDAEWGGSKTQNEFLVTRGAAMLGYTVGELAAERQKPGFSAKLKGFLNVAQKMSEATLEGNDTGGGFKPGAMTGEQAMGRYSDVVEGRDKEFVARRAKGDAAAIKEWANITELVTRHRMAGGR